MGDWTVADLIGVHHGGLVGEGSIGVGVTSVGEDEGTHAGLTCARGGQADDVHGLPGAGVTCDVRHQVDEVVAASCQQLHVVGAGVTFR